MALIKVISEKLKAVNEWEAKAFVNGRHLATAQTKSRRVAEQMAREDAQRALHHATRRQAPAASSLYYANSYAL